VRKNGITDRELEKVRNQQMADLVRGLKTSNGISQQLGYFETVGTYKDFFAYAKALETVTGRRRQALRRDLPQALGPERARDPAEGEEMRIATAALALVLGLPPRRAGHPRASRQAQVSAAEVRGPRRREDPHHAVDRDARRT
jgi:hypothetical protein